MGTKCRLERAVKCLIAAAAFLGGCQESVVGPVRIGNQRFRSMTIAVAPALNVSGSADLDSHRAADLMASELSYVEGIDVIPVSRVLAALADQDRERVESPGHAFELARIIGADALLVFAVTGYDAYEPPVVGIAAQLYGRLPRARTARFDPLGDPRRPAPAPAFATDSSLAPLAQTEHVFDASHEWVSAQVERFARHRSADESPFGWRKYLASQQHYFRFCCHQTLRALMGQDAGEDADVDTKGSKES